MSTCLQSLVFTTTSTMVFSFFHKNNPVAPTLHRMEDLWFTHHLQISTKKSLYFYLFSHSPLTLFFKLMPAFPFHQWQCKFQEPMRFRGFVELDPTSIVMGPHFCKRCYSHKRWCTLGKTFFIALPHLLQLRETSCLSLHEAMFPIPIHT